MAPSQRPCPSPTQAQAALKCAQVSLVSIKIGEVAVELLRDREDNAHLREQVDNKVVPKFLGVNLNYLPCLSQVLDHESLPPVWKALEDAPRRQHLTTLHLAFGETVQRLYVHDKWRSTITYRLYRRHWKMPLRGNS